MLYDFILININITALGHDTPIDIFELSLDSVADIVNDMESNPYAFEDASDTDFF